MKYINENKIYNILKQAKNHNGEDIIEILNKAKNSAKMEWEANKK